MSVISFTFIKDKHSSLIYIIVISKMYINHVLEIESHFKYDQMVNLNIFLVRNAFENLKRAVDFPQKILSRCTHIFFNFIDV